MKARPQYAGLFSRTKRLLLTQTAGVTSLEYGLIGALVAVIMCYGYLTLGSKLNTLFVNVATSL